MRSFSAVVGRLDGMVNLSDASMGREARPRKDEEPPANDADADGAR